jgi:predicted RNA-binding Zn ribbon-like protein
MQALCMDVLNSDWHDWRGSGKNEDRLLQAEWIEQLVTRWNLPVACPPDPATIAALQSLRSLLQSMTQAYLQQQAPSELQIAALNNYLNAAEARLSFEKVDELYQLRQVPLHNDWRWSLREIAVSFATLLVQQDHSRLKRCENPDCRWIFYDESPYRSRRWCADPCANLMRVRRFRARHRAKTC